MDRLFGAKRYTIDTTEVRCNNPTCPLNELQDVEKKIQEIIEMGVKLFFFFGVEELLDKPLLDKLMDKKEKLKEEIKHRGNKR